MTSIHAYGACIHCRRLMAFNSHFVPSIRVKGRKEPLCQACFTEWNRIHRTSQSLEPEPLHPLAYAPTEEA